MGTVKSQKGKRGSWTKYGDSGRKAVVQKRIGAWWYCQACKEKMPAIMDPFLFEFIPGEFMRVCASCVHEKCVKLAIRRIQIEIRYE